MADTDPPEANTANETSADIQEGVEAGTQVAQQAATLAQTEDFDAGAVTSVGDGLSAATEVLPEGEAQEALQTTGEVTSAVGTVASTAQSVGQVAEGGVAGAEVGQVSSALGGGVGAASSAVGGAVGGEAGQALSTIGAVAGAASQVIDLASEGISRLSEFLGRAEQLRAKFDFTVADAGDMPTFIVSSFTLEEELHRPYLAKIRLLVRRDEDEGLDPRSLFGKPATLLITRGDLERPVYGMLREVKHGNSSERFLQIDVELVPAFSLLSETKNRRIFQNKTIPDIVKVVLEPFFKDVDRTLQNELAHEHGEYETVTQWDESDLDFVERILSESGITYSFEPGDGHEVMVLSDDNAKFLPAPSLLGEQTVPYEQRRTSDVSKVESIHDFVMYKRHRPSRIEVADFMWTADQPHHAAEAGEAAEATPFRVLLAGDAFHYTKKDETSYRMDSPSRRAEEHLEGQQSDLPDFWYEGESVVTGFAPGRTFELAGHPSPYLDARYVITRVVHEGRHFDDKSEAARDEFGNRFEAMDVGATYRPLRHRKPSVAGVHSALVVNQDENSNEEICTDVHGRVLVRFPWHRNKGGFGITAWLRVVQAWAGPGYGSLFLPRVGNEVLVSFIDADPYRPIVVGSLYNAISVPPFGKVDEDKTRSGIRTLSSPQSDGYNELSFEDAAGSEEVRLQAQRDLNTKIKRNQSESIGANLSVSVGGNETHSVKKDAKITVEGERTTEITKLEKVTLFNNRETEIQGTELHHVGGLLTEAFGASRETTITGADTLSASDSIQMNSATIACIGSSSVHLVHTDKQSLSLADNAELTSATDFTVANNSVSVASDGATLKLSASEQIVLSCGPASITLKSNGEITISGTTKVALSATQGSSVTVEPAGVTTNSARIVSAAVGIQEITGALVKIN